MFTLSRDMVKPIWILLLLYLFVQRTEFSDVKSSTAAGRIGPCVIKYFYWTSCSNYFWTYLVKSWLAGLSLVTPPRSEWSDAMYLVPRRSKELDINISSDWISVITRSTCRLSLKIRPVSRHLSEQDSLSPCCQHRTIHYILAEEIFVGYYVLIIANFGH